MRVTITNFPRRFAYKDQNVFDIFENALVSIDPSRQYAVVEILLNELFVAITHISYDNDSLTGEYVDCFEYDVTAPIFIKFSVKWDFINFGFCKLVCWAPELFDGFEKTVKRFYFDWELYSNAYQKVNGISCKRRPLAHNES